MARPLREKLFCGFPKEDKRERREVQTQSLHLKESCLKKSLFKLGHGFCWDFFGICSSEELVWRGILCLNGIYESLLGSMPPLFGPSSGIACFEVKKHWCNFRVNCPRWEGGESNPLVDISAIFTSFFYVIPNLVAVAEVVELVGVHHHLHPHRQPRHQRVPKQQNRFERYVNVVISYAYNSLQTAEPAISDDLITKHYISLKVVF